MIWLVASGIENQGGWTGHRIPPTRPAPKPPGGT
jgi:hypothetical protein